MCDQDAEEPGGLLDERLTISQPLADFCLLARAMVVINELVPRTGAAILRYIFEDYVLDTDRRELRRGAEAVSVSPQVFDLLEHFIRNRERVVSKDDLIAAIWDGRIVSDAAVTTRINAARSAIGDSGDAQRLIKTLPRKGFRFVGAVREEIGPAARAIVDIPAEPPKATLTRPDKPSIAVLPFASLSSDLEQEYLADGMAGDIITELSRFSELFVIARNSSFQYRGKAADVRQVGRELGVSYVLDGTVQRRGDRLRISAQLIDAVTSVHRWAEHYDRKLEEVFDVQDEVVRTIVAILAAHVRRAETERTRAKPPNGWQAHDFYLQAGEAFDLFRSSMSSEELGRTQRLLQRSLAIDPTYARSHAFLAVTHTAGYWFHPSGSAFLNPAALNQAYQSAQRALQLDASLPEAHASIGVALAWRGEHDASLAAFERGVALNPNYVDWRFSFALVLAGQSRRAIDVFEAYVRIDPFRTPLASFWAGVAHYMLEEYSQALAILRDFVVRVPRWAVGHGHLAMIYAQTGQLEEACRSAAEALRLQPGLTISAVRAMIAFKCPRDDKHYFDGVRKAGLPE
jgi:TolB-like protein/Tfp pilus assembly protein PilF